jgi:hypothetical protein
MRLIPLTQNQFAQVDDGDYETLVAHKWCARWNPITRTFYAIRNTRRSEGKRQTISMQRQILGLNYGDKRRGDHIDTGDTLNNQRGNLRAATPAQNAYNSRRRRDNKTGYKGVSYSAAMGRFVACIRLNGKTIHLGFHDSAHAAYAAYCKAAPIHHGEFARLA